MKDLSKEIRAYVLKNSIEFGKADPSRILPKLFQHGLEKEDIKSVMRDIKMIVNEVNSLSEKDKKAEYEQYKSYVKEREENEKTLPELPNVSKKMVFRLAPYPSGALHLGNAKTYLINALYAEKYGGKILLVMDDTIGSEEKHIVPEAYGLIEDAFKWLGVNYNPKVIYKSDRLEIYYKYAIQLIKKGRAYVCYCTQEKLRENRAKGIECSCRQFPKKIQLARWEEMFKSEKGDAVLRLKTDMMHPNPAFRDRVLFKISDKKHPRVGNKYSVWPTLEMSWAIDDHLLGITHIIRGNDLMIETDMEKCIWDIFNWKHPETIHVGLVNIEGMGAKISKSKAQEEIKTGEFSGWDDPRTWSIQSLRRRGITAEAIRRFVKEIGLNKQDITIPIESLYAHNRKIIDSTSLRFSFVTEPVKLEIKGRPLILEVEVPIHPDRPEKRKVGIMDIFISKEDYEKYKGKEIRLIHLFNINLDKDEVKAEYVSMDNKDIPKINWVSDYVDAKILMPNGEWIQGLAEKAITTLKPRQTIQFERFGFATFDRKVKKQNNEEIYEFWFAHK